MARLNITLPDVLYARLEQLRDRINLSKVCATALEKEVTMLEGQPPITDPRIAQLLQRLQSTRERWHQRGYEDGVQWAVDLATRDELGRRMWPGCWRPRCGASSRSRPSLPRRLHHHTCSICSGP